MCPEPRLGAGLTGNGFKPFRHPCFREGLMAADEAESTKKRLAAALKILGGVPPPVERDTPHSQWIISDKKKVDPNDLY